MPKGRRLRGGPKKGEPEEPGNGNGKDQQEGPDFFRKTYGSRFWAKEV